MGRVVLDEIKASSPALVQPLAMLANFLAFPVKRDDIVADLDTKVVLILASIHGVHDEFFQSIEIELFFVHLYF